MSNYVYHTLNATVTSVEAMDNGFMSIGFDNGDEAITQFDHPVVGEDGFFKIATHKKTGVRYITY